MKTIKRISILIVLLVIYIYVITINTMPNNIVLFQNEQLSLNTIFGLELQGKVNNEEQVIQVSSNINGTSDISNDIGKKELNLSLLGFIPIKEISVNVIPKTTVIPLGNIIGLKLYTSGVLVVGMSEIEGYDNNIYKPYKDSGIEEGDVIVQVNQRIVSCTADLIENVNSSKGDEVEIIYLRDGEEYTAKVNPAKTEENQYKLGLWVRDAAAGVGTITFYEPSSGKFAALGHGILDVDTESLINISKGEVVTANILSVKKGLKGTPGEIRGSIEKGDTIGQVSKNTSLGIYGILMNTNSLNIDKTKTIEIALKNEIKKGAAKIICDIEGGNKQEYDIEIQKIYLNNDYDNKSMVIKITDEELLEKTGGIIQGMSGSPIIQDGKFARSSHICNGKRPCHGICSICRYDDKTNATNKLGIRQF